MAGVNAQTGRMLEGMEHVEQSIGKILYTWQGERVMREWFGNPGLALLGENMTERTILKWFNICWMLLELFEPRFVITKFDVIDLERGGTADFRMHGKYKPFGHLDFVQASAYISLSEENVTIQIGA